MPEDKKDPKVEGEEKKKEESKDVATDVSAETKVEEEAKVKEKTPEAKKEDTSDDKSTEVKDEKLIPTLKPGMTIRVFQKIKELNIKGEEKERTQYFEGMIIAKKHGKEIGGTITVRKVSDGIGVEKIFPLNLPTITKIEIKKQAKVRRAKLSFLKKGYKKRLKEQKID